MVFGIPWEVYETAEEQQVRDPGLPIDFYRIVESHRSIRIHELIRRKILDHEHQDKRKQVDTEHEEKEDKDFRIFEDPRHEIPVISIDDRIDIVADQHSKEISKLHNPYILHHTHTD